MQLSHNLAQPGCQHFVNTHRAFNSLPQLWVDRLKNNFRAFSASVSVYSVLVAQHDEASSTARLQCYEQSEHLSGDAPIARIHVVRSSQTDENVVASMINFFDRSAFDHESSMVARTYEHCSQQRRRKNRRQAVGKEPLGQSHESWEHCRPQHLAEMGENQRTPCLQGDERKGLVRHATVQKGIFFWNNQQGSS